MERGKERYVRGREERDGEAPFSFLPFSHKGEMGKKVKGVGVTYKGRRVGICTSPSRSIDHS